MIQEDSQVKTQKESYIPIQESQVLIQDKSQILIQDESQVLIQKKPQISIDTKAKKRMSRLTEEEIQLKLARPFRPPLQTLQDQTQNIIMAKDGTTNIFEFHNSGNILAVAENQIVAPSHVLAEKGIRYVQENVDTFYAGNAKFLYYMFKYEYLNKIQQHLEQQILKQPLSQQYDSQQISILAPIGVNLVKSVNITREYEATVKWIGHLINDD
ncbi:13729_t:CDS:2, partial [Dentiscutata heterogama]